MPRISLSLTVDISSSMVEILRRVWINQLTAYFRVFCILKNLVVDLIDATRMYRLGSELFYKLLFSCVKKA